MVFHPISIGVASDIPCCSVSSHDLVNNTPVDSHNVSDDESNEENVLNSCIGLDVDPGKF